MTDISGLFQTIDVFMVIFAGIIMPLSFYPPMLQKIAYLLPFAYYYYIPVTVMQSNLLLSAQINIILMQLFWLILAIFIYKKMWHAGVKKFTAVGQ